MISGREALARRKARRSRRREQRRRPGSTPGMPKGWAQLSRRVKARDQATCRWCGGPAPEGAANHIIPRRLFPNGRLASFEANLAWVHGDCHAHFTQRIEPALYSGDVLTFSLALAVLRQSGLVPGPEQLATAFKRLAGHLRRRRERG